MAMSPERVRGRVECGSVIGRDEQYSDRANAEEVDVTTQFTLTTLIAAPAGRLFDLALSVEDHLASMSSSKERVAWGVSTGVLGLGDEVTWAAQHFGIPWRMHVRISEFDRPRRFVDEQVDGPFVSFRHEHRFEGTGGATRMIDAVAFSAPFGLLGWIAERAVLGRYLRGLIERRAEYLRSIAEGRADG